jgi:hypothetical protein
MAAGEITPRPRAGTARGTGAAPAARGGVDVAVRDNTTHGAWVCNVEAVIAALAYIKLRQEAIMADLTSVNASRQQIRDIRAWSADVTATAMSILIGLGRIDASIRHLIEGYRQIGGVEMGADPAFYRDI